MQRILLTTPKLGKSMTSGEIIWNLYGHTKYLECKLFLINYSGHWEKLWFSDDHVQVVLKCSNLFSVSKTNY